jgi:glycosyltransferase involved in cell wall biosynthesis
MAKLDKDIDLVMAGPDQLGWVQKLNAMAASLGIENRIHWTGMLKGQLKWGAIRSAEAAILPSHQENFGVVVAEAMSCSTPVLISDKVNIWREVQNSGAGLVEPDTLEGTRHLIQTFAELSDEQHQQMRTAARREFLRSFEIEAVAYDLMRQIGFVEKGCLCGANKVAE